MIILLAREECDVVWRRKINFFAFFAAVLQDRKWRALVTQETSYRSNDK